MKRACIVLGLSALISACGLFEKPGGGNEDKTERYRSKLARAPVQPIPQEKLASLLPTVEGWKAHPPQATTTKVGEHSVTSASTTYVQDVDGGGATVALELIDGAYVPAVYAPFAVMSHSQGASDVHKMRVDIEGHPGIEEFKTETREVSLALMVARRFVVTLKGKNAHPGVARQYVKALNLKNLTSLAEASASPAQ